MGLSSQVSYVKGLYGALAKWPLGFSPKTASYSDYTVIMGAGKSTDPEASAVDGANFMDFYLKTTAPASGSTDVAGLKIQLDVQGTGSGYAIKATGLNGGGSTHAELGGIYAQARVSGGRVSGQTYAGFFEYIIDEGISNPSKGGPIQLVSWVDGALNAVSGFIGLRDYGANPMVNLFDIDPEITSGTGKMWYGSTLRIRINDGAKYLFLSDAENALTFSGDLNLTGNLVITAGDIDLSASTTGVYDLILKAAQADALSIKFSSTDMMVFDTNTPKITITPATDITGKVTLGADLALTAGDIDLSAGATGTYDMILKDSVADALSIRRATTDMMVFDSSTPKISITPATDIAGVLSVTNATEASAVGTAALVVTGGIGVAKKAYVGTDLVMVGGDIDLSTAVTGTYDLILKDSVADALSIRRNTTDMMVFDSSTPKITITPAVDITGAVALGNTLSVTGLLSANGGVSVGGMTLTPDATRTYIGYQVGNRVTEKGITMVAAASQNLDPIQANLNIIGANPSGTSTVNMSWFNITHDTVDMSNLRLKCADWNVAVGKAVQDVYIYQGEIDFSGSPTASGEVSVMGLVLDGGSGSPVCNSWRVLNCTLRGAGTPVDAHGIMVNAESGCTVSDGIRLMADGTMTCAIRIGNGSYLQSPTNFVGFPESGTGPVSSAGGSTHSGTVVKIACKVGSATYYMLASTAIS